MGGMAMGLYGNLKRFWSRRQYQRLDHHEDYPRRSRLRMIRLGGGINSRRLWKMRVLPRVHVRLPSLAKRMLGGLRDRYVDAMLRLSGSGGLFLGSANGLPSKKVSASRKEAVFFDSDVERRVIYELYKTLAASQRLAAYY